MPLNNPSAPTAADGLAICPHCWHVNSIAARLCARCLADMTLLLQESGGRRWTAAVQSPVPVRVGHRLTRAQRWLVLGFVALLGLAQLAVAFAPPRAHPRASAAPAAP